MDEISKLQQGIEALEAQRSILGDEVVDVSLAPLKARLAELRATPPHQEQRKQVTVLFADVSGFTAMSETMDAEDVQGTMNALWQQVDQCILDHNGRIDKHIGDAVMALWGTEEAREDDPEQAIRAALAMQTAVKNFSKEHHTPLKMRIGLNTGPVLLGEVGTTAEFTAMGDTVNTASRLEHAAPVGGILISHDTYRHVRGVFDVEPQNPLTVKGKIELLHVYVVKAAKPRAFRMGTRGVEGIETKTIGRDSELEQLQSVYITAIQQKQTTVITIVGEAGMGKSRLLYEFDQWIELRPEKIRFFKGRASQQTQGIPHFLLRDMLADRFQILDSDPLEALRQKFVAGVCEQLPEDGQMKAHILGAWLGYDFSGSSHLQPIQDEPEQIKNRATLYLAQYFTAIGEQQPVVIFLEDIHWADSGSLDAVIDLTRRRAQLPLVVFCLTRPLLYERQPNWGEKIPVHTGMNLSPLSAESTRALVAEIMRLIVPLPEVLLELVSGRAEGNPFYAEELIKMLIDDGVIIAGTEIWRVAPEQLLELKVPSTLTGVLQARLDKLQPEERQAIQQASVIGRVFWDQALAQIDAKSYSALPTLQDREFIFPRTNSAFVEAEEYTFKHALLRDVTYESVLKRLRRQYHALIADWLVAAAEANGRSDEYAPVIGEHYQLAEQLDLAAIWYRLAGQQAIATYAYEEAARYLTLALQFTPEDDTIAQYTILEAREKAYDMQGNREAQRQDLDFLFTLASSIGVIEQARIALQQADFGNATSDYDQAIAHAQAAIELGQRGEDMQTVAGGYAAWGKSLSRQGEYLLAQEQLRTGLLIAESISDQKQAANCLNGLGVVITDQGNFVTAREYLRRALDIKREIGDRRGEGISLNNLGTITDIQGDYVNAQAYYEQALAIFHEIGDREGEGVIPSNLGVIAMNQGDYATAQRYFELALLIRGEIGNRHGEAVSLINLGSVSIYQGEEDTAIQYLEQALAICREIGDRDGIGTCLNEMGAVQLFQLNLPSAENFYMQSLIIREELSQPHFLVEDWAGLARVKLAQNDWKSARQYGQKTLVYLKENPYLDGAENSMRTFRFIWEVLAALGQLEEAENVLALAAEIIQDYLEKNQDPALHEMYLNQPHHKILWTAWGEKQK